MPPEQACHAVAAAIDAKDCTALAVAIRKGGRGKRYSPRMRAARGCYAACERVTATFGGPVLKLLLRAEPIDFSKTFFGTACSKKDAFSLLVALARCPINRVYASIYEAATVRQSVAGGTLGVREYEYEDYGEDNEPRFVYDVYPLVPTWQEIYAMGGLDMLKVYIDLGILSDGVSRNDDDDEPPAVVWSLFSCVTAIHRVRAPLSREIVHDMLEAVQYACKTREELRKSVQWAAYWCSYYGVADGAEGPLADAARLAIDGLDDCEKTVFNDRRVALAARGALDDGRANDAAGAVKVASPAGLLAIEREVEKSAVVASSPTAGVPPSPAATGAYTYVGCDRSENPRRMILACVAAVNRAIARRRLEHCAAVA